MRPVAIIAGLLLALPLLTANPASADNNDFFNQAQKFFNNGSDRDAYQRGREDQARHDEWQRERQAERWRERREAERAYRYYNRDYDYR
jgi:hypothetical protein